VFNRRWRALLLRGFSTSSGDQRTALLWVLVGVFLQFVAVLLAAIA
jgi:hypothetical protein